MYEIGQVYVFDGVERKVIGMDGPYPVTTTDLGYEPEKPVADTEGLREQLEREYAEKAEAEQVSACKGLLALLPLDKCNKEELLSIAAYIGQEIKAADGQEPAKAGIITAILGA